MAQQVFISHSAADREVARSLKTRIEETGATVWLAGDSIKPGARFADVIRKQLEQSDVVLLLIGRKPSHSARDEWSQALRLASDPAREVRIIPVVLDDAEPPAFLGEYASVRLDSEELLEHGGGWEPPSAWEWRTTPLAKRKLADRLSEISGIATSLERDARQSE